MVKITKFETQNETLKYLGKQIGERIRGKDTLLLLSGGSALRVLDYVDDEVLSDKLTCGMVDERNSSDPSINNYLAVADTVFMKRSIERGVRWIVSVPSGGDLPEVLAQSMEKAWRSSVENLRETIVVSLLGMGPDTHTAGIFPAEENTFNDRFRSGEWVTGYTTDSPVVSPERITATPTFLIDVVDFAYVFVSGDEKRSALHKVMESQADIHICPARIFHAIKKCEIATDIDIDVQ